jgi:hypothetical protein
MSFLSLISKRSRKNVIFRLKTVFRFKNFKNAGFYHLKNYIFASKMRFFSRERLP